MAADSTIVATGVNVSSSGSCSIARRLWSLLLLLFTLVLHAPRLWPVASGWGEGPRREAGRRRRETGRLAAASERGEQHKARGYRYSGGAQWRLPTRSE